MFQLIEKSKWKKIRRILKSSKAFEKLQERDSSNLTCLSFALGHGAPVEIIQQIVSIDISLVTAKDVYGASSLHVACLNGAPLEAVQFLVSHFKGLGTMLDCDQRAPLHHAVEYAVQSGDDQNTYMDVIRLLCHKAPSMVHMNDLQGDTPIDLVQLVKVNLIETSREYARLHRIYSLLRETSVSEYRKNKNRWELEGYINQMALEDDTARSITSDIGSYPSTTGTPSIISGRTTRTGDSLNSLIRQKKRTLSET